MVFVAGLTSTPIANVAEFDGLYSMVTARRSVGATLLNRESSRSHAVLTLTLRVRVVDPVTGAPKVREGKISLVDLAGSENNKRTGNDPSRMAESAAINKSLSVLGQVVHALNIGAPQIPYRNAKLTRILRDALGGSSVGLLIRNLSLAVKFRQDTLNTLNFAVRTKNIENKPVVNERDIRPPQPKIDFSACACPGAQVRRGANAPRRTTLARVASSPTHHLCLRWRPSPSRCQSAGGLADALSPVSKKRTGRAYILCRVATASAPSESRIGGGLRVGGVRESRSGEMHGSPHSRVRLRLHQDRRRGRGAPTGR
ncbi:P-loop containing nucleoside triphosphate hydrolase protein [Mycena capillaripes]|nr:P-loop containing nucleoside triphosphate hydrolase protein [Mycena capillaripes]